MAGEYSPAVRVLLKVSQHDYRRVHRLPSIYLSRGQSSARHLCTHERGQTTERLLDLASESSLAHLLTDTLIDTLRQCCEHTQLHMVDTYWPEFGVFDLVPILLEYQRKVWAEQ